MRRPLVYLDSSVALRTILDVPERRRLQSWMEEAGDLVSSRLLRTEVIRVLRRDDRPLADGTPLLDRVGLLEIGRETHTVAESIERHVTTLEALHLATALLIGEPITVATHDRTMGVSPSTWVWASSIPSACRTAEHIPRDPHLIHLRVGRRVAPRVAVTSRARPTGAGRGDQPR